MPHLGTSEGSSKVPRYIALLGRFRLFEFQIACRVGQTERGAFTDVKTVLNLRRGFVPYFATIRWRSCLTRGTFFF